LSVTEHMTLGVTADTGGRTPHTAMKYAGQQINTIDYSSSLSLTCGGQTNPTHYSYRRIL